MLKTIFALSFLIWVVYPFLCYNTFNERTFFIIVGFGVVASLIEGDGYYVRRK